MKVIETDNFGGDYPNEQFVVTKSISPELAEAVASELNRKDGPASPRYHRAVADDYELVPGFTP